MAHSLPGTEGAESPFWSPDNRWIGYFADAKLQKIPASGGPSQLIAAVPDNRLASWGPDDTILLATGVTGILRVSSSGGTVTPVTELDTSRQEGSHRFPQFLPDGRHFLFMVRSNLADQAGAYQGPSTARRRSCSFVATRARSMRFPAMCCSWMATP